MKYPFGKKLCSILLAAALLLGCIPAPVFAEETVTAAEETAPAETVPVTEPETRPVEEATELTAPGENIGSGTPDGTPPVLNGITLSATEVTAPGEIEVIVDASDDVSGVMHAQVDFYCAETGKCLSVGTESTYFDEEIWQRVVYPDGKLHGILEVDQYVESGTFAVCEVYVVDAAGNLTHYVAEDEYYEGSEVLPATVSALKFMVMETDDADGTSPVLNGITLSATEVTAPGEIEVIVDASDDVSGVMHAQVDFYCAETGKRLSVGTESTYFDEEIWQRVVYPDGKLHGILEVNQYVESGTFAICEVYVVDAAGNLTHYVAEDQYYEGSEVLPESVRFLRLNVFNTTPDITTSVSGSTFVSDLENAADDAYIAADYSGDATMPKEAFEAIAGTDKTIDLISEGITWRFEGNDITEEIKDIDLKVDIQKVEEDSSASGDAIADSLKGNPGVVMKFPENGTLPGKATIQVKVDYAMRDYLGTDEKLCVYYFNNQTGQLELIAEDLSVINDTYVEFEITHCSYYVLTTASGSSGTTASGTCGDNLTWTFDPASATLTISGEGAMYDYGSGFAPWSVYGDQVKEIILKEGVTRIGDYAFSSCTWLEKAFIPATIREVGEFTFAPIMGGREYVINQTVRQWSKVQDETQYFPDWEMTRFVNEAPIVASGVYGEQVYWELDENGEMVFFGTGDMYDFGAVPTLWGDMAVKSITIEEGVTRIGHCAFEVSGTSTFSQTLSSVKIPSTMTYIGGLAFSVCKALKTITFTGNAPTFDSVAFDGVTATAYYPANDPTWTDSVKQNYGGTITWLATGDCNADGEVDTQDALALLWYAAFPEVYPLKGNGDVNRDGTVDTDDAVYLIWHTLFPGFYPV